MDQSKSCCVKRVQPQHSSWVSDVRFIINWGSAWSILKQHREAGRAGRDGTRAHVVVTYHWQQVGHRKQQIKDFVRTKDCFHVAAYKSSENSALRRDWH